MRARPFSHAADAIMCASCSLMLPMAIMRRSPWASRFVAPLTVRWLPQVGRAAMAAAAEAWSAFADAAEQLIGDWFDELVAKAATEVLTTQFADKIAAAVAELPPWTVGQAGGTAQADNLSPLCRGQWIAARMANQVFNDFHCLPLAFHCLFSMPFNTCPGRGRGAQRRARRLPQDPAGRARARRRRVQVPRALRVLLRVRGVPLARGGGGRKLRYFCACLIHAVRVSHTLYTVSSLCMWRRGVDMTC